MSSRGFTQRGKLKMARITVWFALAVSAIPGVAHAYIDPGTGSVLVQALIAAVAMVGVFFGRIQAAIRRYLTRKDRPAGEFGDQNTPR